MLVSRRRFFQCVFWLPLALDVTKYLEKETARRHLLLNRFYIAGFQYYDGPALVKGLGRGEEVVISVQTEGPGDEPLFERSYRGPNMSHCGLRPGDILTLRREPRNPYDSFAVEIIRGDIKLGYVPRTDNIHISRLLGQGARLTCRPVHVDPHTVPWEMVKAEVVLEV